MLNKKTLTLVPFVLTTFSAQAAAPDDISNNLHAWYDAVDINANNNFTDNPGNNTPVSTWNDKSGFGNHISAENNYDRPVYRHNSIGTQRHTVDFDGLGDRLLRNGDIWSGSVSRSEVFIVTTTDQIKNSSIFSSTDYGSNRLSSHIPWGNARTYFDQGVCCGSPTRLSGDINITLNRPYFWHYIGLPNSQMVVRNGKVRLSDPGSGIYYVTNNSRFALGGWAINRSNSPHHGRIAEALFYQTELNRAQRRILGSYLSAKWGISFAAIPNFADVYSGDNPAQGNYDFFVSGIGQDNGGNQTTATSQGLTISNINFLQSGKYIMAGVNYLLTTPPTGTITNDLPAGYESRSKRSWYIDRTGNGGQVRLSFNANEIGLSIQNGDRYGLLYRAGTSGTFTEVATANMLGGVVSFDYLPADGVYTLGKKAGPQLSLKKTSKTVYDPVNLTNIPKAIPGAYIDYTLTVKNNGYGSPDANGLTITDSVPANVVFFAGDLNGSSSGNSPFIFTPDCPQEATTSNSNLTYNPANAILKNAAGTPILPSGDFDPAVKSFQVTFSGTMNTISGGTAPPCFTLNYRVRIE